MAQAKVSWHFPRSLLAKAYLDAVEAGLVSAYALFAPRRHGKTEFLTYDIAPAAIARGYLVSYVNLWDDRDRPVSALINALRQPQGSRSLVARLARRASNKVRKVKVGAKIASVAEASAEVEWDRPDSQGAGLRELHQLLKSAASGRHPTLLLLDEAHVLADARNENLSASLRAGLDVRKDAIKVIFTGSSETALRRMFGQVKLPFYNWAPIEAFPLLGRDFVEHQVQTFNALSRHSLPVVDGLRAFKQLQGVPEYFRRFLDHLLRHPLDGVNTALEHTRSRIQSDLDYPGTWGRMKAIDRIVLQLVVSGETALQSLATRSRLGDLLGLGKPVDTPTIQNALRRQVGAQVLVRLGHGSYRFEDIQFAQWIAENDPAM